MVDEVSDEVVRQLTQVFGGEDRIGQLSSNIQGFVIFIRLVNSLANLIFIYISNTLLHEDYRNIKKSCRTIRNT